MADRTFSSACGYEKAAPSFQFVKDSVTNQWRPVTSADMSNSVNVSGDLLISGLIVNTDDLERLASGQLVTLSAISGLLAPTQVYPFYIRSTNADVAISQQVNSISYSNVGTGTGILYMGATPKNIEPYETISFDGYNNYFTAPRFVSSGTIMVVNGTSKISSVTSL